MKALISPEENNRICEVTEQPFDVAEPLYWVDCAPGVTRATHRFDGQQFLEIVPDPQAIVAAFTASIQQRLDDFARTRNYDGILSACTYATDPNPKLAAEGQYCVVKRGETWATGYAILEEVQLGTRPMPASIADIEADLPVLVWPT